MKRTRSSSDAPVTSRRDEAEAERLETWKQTQQLRNTYAHVMHTRASTPGDWQKWLEGVPVAHRFVGRAGEAHRVFVFSADTFGREGDEPW